MSNFALEPVRDIKYCKRCGRRLRSTDAQIKGYGPKCYEKAQAEKSRPALITVIKRS